MLLVNPGKYTAKLFVPESVQTNSGIVVYKTTGNALCASIPCEIVDEGPFIGKQLKSTQTIVKSDKTPNQRTIDMLREVFGWSTPDTDWLQETNLEEVRFEIVVEAEQGVDKEKRLMIDENGEPIYFSRIAWINPPGGGFKMPEPASSAAIKAEFGSILRAVMGGTSAKAPPKAPAKAPARKKAPPAPPATKAPEPEAPVSGATSTMQDAWNALCTANPGENEDKLTSIWFDAMRLHFHTDDNTKLTPKDWAKFIEVINDNVPY